MTTSHQRTSIASNSERSRQETGYSATNDIHSPKAMYSQLGDIGLLRRLRQYSISVSSMSAIIPDCCHNHRHPVVSCHRFSMTMPQHKPDSHQLGDNSRSSAVCLQLFAVGYSWSLLISMFRLIVFPPKLYYLIDLTEHFHSRPAFIIFNKLKGWIISLRLKHLYALKWRRLESSFVFDSQVCCGTVSSFSWAQELTQAHKFYVELISGEVCNFQQNFPTFYI